jgi:prepilin-type N-terminal cleavage/methylation domain-containing protein
MRQRDQGLTLIELIITIALVAVVASVALPVFHDLVTTEQAKADSQSAQNRNAFANDWISSGYAPDASGNVSIDGVAVASIAQDRNSTTFYMPGTDFTTNSMFYWAGTTWIGTPSQNLLDALATKHAGDNIYINDVAYPLYETSIGSWTGVCYGSGNSFYINATFPAALAGTQITSIHF